MVFGTGGYGPIIYGYHERLLGVPVPVVHQKPQVLHQESYNGVSFLTGDYRNEERRYTWKDLASETTMGEYLLKETSGICVVPR